MIKILKDAIRAVPAMRYALAVAGLMSVVGLVGAFRISPLTAVFGAVVVLVLMVAVVVFARLAATGPRHFFVPVLVMLWSFLGLVVATAFLLFSCAFFQWPKAIHDLIGGPSASQHSEPGKKVAELLNGARLQLDARDYPGAWRTVEEAVRLAPGSATGMELQAEVAMAWTRDMEVTAPTTFSEVVDRISPCLYQSVAHAKGTHAADLYAHLGWGNFLKSREGPENLKIEEYFQKAFELDPTNPYAQAMWGHWLLTQRRQMGASKAHFQKALESGRARPYVRDLQLAALRWGGSKENSEELLRVFNEMRLGKETLPISRRGREGLLMSMYSIGSAAHFLEEMPSFQPPADHLATFVWLSEGVDVGRSATLGLVRAYLTEAAGDFSKALSLYRILLAEPGIFGEPIQAGMDRCKRQMGDARPEAEAMIEQARSADILTRVKLIQGLPRSGIDAVDFMPALVVWAKDQNNQVREAACEALVKVGKRAVPQVVTLLSSREERDVLSGVKMLGEIGQEPKVAIPALVGALKQPDSETLKETLKALAGFGQDAAPAVPALLEFMARGDKTRLQQEIAYTLGEIGPGAKEAVPQLLELLKSGKDSDGFLKNVVAEALGKIGPAAAPAVPFLVLALKSDDVRLPTTAAEALGNIGAGASPGIPGLIEAMEATEKEYRITYAEPLGKIALALMDAGDTQSLPLLTRALKALETAGLEAKAVSPVRDAVAFLRQKP
jgi:HEAT repeat protein